MTAPTEWKIGTAWDSSSWPCRLLCYDYLAEVKFAPGIGDASIIFADPPYNIGVEYADDTTKDKLSSEQYRDFTRCTLSMMRRAARPGATVWWMVPEEHADWVGQMLTEMIGPRLYRIVWEESFAQYQGDRALTKDYRFIFCHQYTPGGLGNGDQILKAFKDKLTFNPNDIRVPSARQLLYKDKRANTKGRVPGTTWRFEQPSSLDDLARSVVIALPHTITHDEVRYTPLRKGSGSAHTDLHNAVKAALGMVLGTEIVPGEIWKFRRLQGTSVDRVDWHPAQLPPELLARMVKGWSDKDDLIVDAFAGSGSLGRVCRSLGRKFLGVDQSPTYLSKMSEDFQ